MFRPRSLFFLASGISATFIYSCKSTADDDNDELLTKEYFSLKKLLPIKKCNNFYNSLLFSSHIKLAYAETSAVYVNNQQESIEKDALLKRMKPFEQRFHKFASIEYNDNVYMTPRDLLDSLTLSKPRGKKYLRVLDDSEVRHILSSTPKLCRSTSKFLRNQDTTGLISYSEYLFLLGVLTKPRSGFGIAFSMFDKDGNQEIDMPEFLVLNQIIAGISHNEQDATLIEKKAEIAGTIHKPNTTILVHFFGSNGRGKVKYRDFEKFMENFQTEILEIEFLEYSRGYRTMSEVDFARVLLQYSKISAEQHEVILDRVKSHVIKSNGITFDEFQKFFIFLNSLADFSLAMKMYTLADRAISKQEFQLAVNASVGFKLADTLVHTLFLVFDADNDGHLSHKEFVKNMRDRLTRGLFETSPSTRWHSFQRCMQQVVKDS